MKNKNLFLIYFTSLILIINLKATKELSLVGQCLEEQVLDKFVDNCVKDEDCIKAGIGSNCCTFNNESYCVKNIIDPQTFDCVLYEGNFTGNRIELRNGETRRNFNQSQSQNNGYRSIKINSKNCRLKLCVNDHVKGIKSCFSHLSGDYFKEKSLYQIIYHVIVGLTKMFSIKTRLIQ